MMTFEQSSSPTQVPSLRGGSAKKFSGFCEAVWETARTEKETVELRLPSWVEKERTLTDEEDKPWILFLGWQKVLY